jgi:glycosyltransferase involved in cell wall biosynthesis
MSPKTSPKKARPVTVCFVSHSSGGGGAERVLLETVEPLQSQGFGCRVLLPEEGPFCGELTRLGVPFSVISYPMWMGRGKASLGIRVKAALNLVKDTLEVAWQISRWKCDVVYSNTATVCVGAFAARLLGLPHVWHLHEFGLEDQGLSFLFGERRSMALIGRLSSRCICVSSALARKYEQSIDPSKITVIYPSMHRAFCDTESLSYNPDPAVLPAERFRCVIVGALIEGKGQRDAILALADLRKAGISAELVIVGQGEAQYRRSLEELVKGINLEKEVTFIEQVKNALPIMRSAKVVLVCSKSEAFGRVTIEGMFSGTPVVGTRSAATAELIKDGVNGLLYSQGDPADLAAKIEYLYKNAAIAADLGRNAHSWVETCFTRERCTRELVAVLDSLSLSPARAMGRAGIA